MDRYWFLTTTTYGTWLPGDARGFVGWERDALGAEWIHNLPGTEYDADVLELREYAAQQMTGPPILLTAAQADALLCQFHETAMHRRWSLAAVAIMRTHFHLVGVNGDPKPGRVLGAFKGYASRRLNEGWGRPLSETWWTVRGSKRKLDHEAAVLAAIEYIRRQPNALVIWIAGENRPPRGV